MLATTAEQVGSVERHRHLSDLLTTHELHESTRERLINTFGIITQATLGMLCGLCIPIYTLGPDNGLLNVESMFIQLLLFTSIIVIGSYVDLNQKYRAMMMIACVFIGFLLWAFRNDPKEEHIYLHCICVVFISSLSFLVALYSTSISRLRCVFVGLFLSLVFVITSESAFLMAKTRFSFVDVIMTLSSISFPSWISLYCLIAMDKLSRASIEYRELVNGLWYYPFHFLSAR